MSDTLVINAEFRQQVGKGASRRLRNQGGKVPGILYGAGEEAMPLTMDYNDLSKIMQDEAFYSQILEIKVQDKSQQAILRDVQRNPSSERVTHLDFLRITADKPIQVSIPLHFVNEEDCVGVKTEGGSITHNLNEVEIVSLPADLPEFIEVDMTNLELNASIHLSDLELPEAVSIVALGLGEDHDITVASVVPIRIVEEEEPIEVTDDEDADGEISDAADGTEEAGEAGEEGTEEE